MNRVASFLSLSSPSSYSHPPTSASSSSNHLSLGFPLILLHPALLLIFIRYPLHVSLHYFFLTVHFTVATLYSFLRAAGVRIFYGFSNLRAPLLDQRSLSSEDHTFPNLPWHLLFLANKMPTYFWQSNSHRIFTNNYIIPFI